MKMQLLILKKWNKKKVKFFGPTFSPREYFLWYFANYTWLSEINSNQVQFILLEHLEEAWVLAAFCLRAVWQRRLRCPSPRRPVPGVPKTHTSGARWPYLHSCPHTWLFTKLWLSVHQAPPPSPDNESRCLLSPLASNQRRCSLPVSPPLILLRAKNSAWKKCTRYKHVMYTNYVNLRRCRWLGVDCGFRIRSGSLKFECGRHVTLITAQPQPSIPLSPVIHLCWLSPADKAAHKS